MTQGLITIFGGSGFVGRHLVRRLAAAGYRMRIAVRRPMDARPLQPQGDVGQIVPVLCNVRSDSSVAAAIDGAEVVVNLVGVLHSGGEQSFEALHEEAPARIARLAGTAGVRRVVHVSALGADLESPSAYARSKARGEEALRNAFPSAVVMRPSVIFGPEDGFFNRFAALVRMLPAIPIFGDAPATAGATRLQPVYVGDVGAAIASVLQASASPGKIHALGGPDTMSVRQVFEYVMACTGRRRPFMPLPYAVAMAQATFLGMLPNPPLTRDQVRLLRIDNVVPAGALGLADLGVVPTPVGSVVPGYLARFRRHAAVVTA
ncbi:MAG: complex I NDUFA9 subunit family protein [Alphaproteobacteria bacterium]|nr:complex I NDUFA9 subunit family protein [Alphaproteobacteria bacterium]